MRRLPLFALALISTALLGGCNFFNRGSDTDVADVPAEDGAPVVTADAPESEGLPTPAQSDFADPVVPADDAVTVVAPDLIQSTDPNERAIGVQRSRPDPFASLPIPPTPPEPIVSPTATGARAQPSNAASQGGAAAATAANPSSTPTVSAPSDGGASAAAASPSRTPAVTPNVAAANPAATLPPVPQPTTARAVRISGVVQIGGTPYAIVQAPNEVERYVRAGERIASGSVLVKRIDTRSVEPRVILEQNGIEVIANVTAGSAGVATDLPEPPSTPQASLVSANTLSASEL
ncbi:MAG: hypothetical protein AAFU71_07195 [Cyanobacteria bacterium J06632_22]